MDTEQHLEAGRLEDALQCLQAAVRNKPEDHGLRLQLFEQLALLGQWERCATQLELVGNLNPSSFMFVSVYLETIRGERERQKVFEGQAEPLIFGEPEPWMAWYIQAFALLRQGDYAGARELRRKALDAAPTVAGQINGTPLEWVADTDPRFGPFLEVILSGKYYWIPFMRIAKLVPEKAGAWRDLVWLPALFTWTNGGQMPGFIPVRYPGTTQTGQAQYILGRMTDWSNQPENTQLGLGQRMLATDKDDYPLLQVTCLELGSPP
jgi:type VI secretion system protein ImpE